MDVPIFAFYYLLTLLSPENTVPANAVVTLMEKAHLFPQT